MGAGLGLSNFFLFLCLFYFIYAFPFSFSSFSLTHFVIFLIFSVSFFLCFFLCVFFLFFSFSFSFYFALNLEKQNHFFYSKRAPIPAKTEVLHEKLKTVLPMVILKFIFSSSNFTKF